MADVKTGVADITAHELTLKDQRAILQTAAEKAQQTLDDVQSVTAVDPVSHLADDMNMSEMMIICRCSEDDILNLTESELIKVAKACRAANPLFFAKREAAAAQTREWIKSNPDLINQFLTKSGNSKEAQPH